MKCKILYISKYVVPAYAANVSARGFLILKEFARRGINAKLITSDSNHLANPPKFKEIFFEEQVDGVNVVWLKVKKYYSARSFNRIISWFDFEFKLLSYLRNLKERPDIVIVSSLSILSILNGIFLKYRTGCKLILEVRDIWPLVLVEAGGYSKFNPFIFFLSWVEKIGYKKADVIVGLMPNLKKHVENVLGYTKEVFCVPHGFDPDLINAENKIPEEYIENYIPKNKFVVCHAGSIGIDNALDTLIQCSKLLLDNDSIHFLIVGEGYLKNSYIEMTKGQRNITFAPRVEKNHVNSLLGNVDVVYFATHDSPVLDFGQSLNKVIDYMLAGKPIVASFSGFPSMIDESGCGSFVPAADAEALALEIKKYYHMSYDDLRKMGDAGRKWVWENRKISDLADAYINIFGMKNG